MIDMSKVRFALVGAGAVASHHINALRQIDDVEIKMVCDRDEKAGLEFSKKFDIPWTMNLKECLDDPDIDVIDAAVPSGLHAEIGIAAAGAGKHVVVEKPIDVTLEKADALINACAGAGVKLGVISQYRYMDPVRSLYETVEEGRLGELIEGDAYIKWYRSQAYYDSGAWRGTWALDGGGPFINQGIHFIDLLLSVMGPAKWVYAKTKNVAHDTEVEDIGMAMVEFDSGAYGVIQASTAIFPGLPARLDIHGTKGTMSVEGEKLAFKHIEGEEPYRNVDVFAAGASSPMSIDVTPFVRQFTDIVSAIGENREPQVNGAEARRSLQLILSIYESSRKGQPLRL
jgi:predicted dehydrogenase